MLEKRRFLRLPIKREAIGVVKIVTEMMDVSINGCFLATNISFSPGTVIQVQFSLPNLHKEIQATGTVHWSGDYTCSNRADLTHGIGLQWSDIAIEDRALIHEHIKTCLNPCRKHARKSINFSVYCLDIESGDGFIVEAKDLSLGGLFVKSNRRMEKDRILKLKFLLPGAKERIDCEGKVIWSHGNSEEPCSLVPQAGMGIEFLNLSERQLEIIDQILDPYPEKDADVNDKAIPVLKASSMGLL